MMGGGLQTPSANVSGDSDCPDNLGRGTSIIMHTDTCLVVRMSGVGPAEALLWSGRLPVRRS